MRILVVGATGATGRLLVEELLKRGHDVKAIVRSLDSLRDLKNKHDDLLILISASILDLSNTELAQHVEGCNVVASCLGHNITFKGLFGQPRRLVTDAARRLCDAIKENKPQAKTKFLLMNTAGNSNRDLSEPISFAQRCVLSLLRLLVPPHVDNEKAADFLRTEIGQNDESIEWVVVRPDSLKNKDEVTEYEVHSSPTRSAIFNPGETSRINVGYFMAELIDHEDLWNRWQGQMPVLYNKRST